MCGMGTSLAPHTTAKKFHLATLFCGYCAFTEVEKLRKVTHSDSKVRD